MSSTTSAGERRKKIITYGKSSRLSIPPPQTNITEEDAPSPERPHKHIKILNGPAADTERTPKIAQTSNNARAATASLDVFDFPSEDEFESQSIKPANTKRPAITAKKDPLRPNRPIAPTSRPPKQTEIVKPVEPTVKLVQGRIKPQRSASEHVALSKLSPATTTSQRKMLQAVESQKQVNTSGQRLNRSNATSKAIPRTTASALPAQARPTPRSVPQDATAEPTKKATTPLSKQPRNRNVFDVPSEDDEVSSSVSEPHRQISRQFSKGTVKQSTTLKGSTPSIPKKVATKSNELGNLQNRKRKGSVSSVAVPRSMSGERAQDSLIAQRGRKVLKREKEASLGYGSIKPLASRSAPHVVTAEATINKPKRTRTRTVPVLSQPGMFKGHSSPAMLHSMVPKDERASNDSPNDLLASDDTMYDIPDPVATPVRPTPLRQTTTSTPGSVTPRQKDLFSTLLGSSATPKTPASALASLQLTDKKPRSLLGALARSKSDLSYSGRSRKTPLIGALREECTSSEEDDSDSDEEADSTTVVDVPGDQDSTPRQPKTTVAKRNTDDVGMDDITAASSQGSQIPSGGVPRPRLTYAAQRSYLQETNPEDELLMSMDIDDNWKMDSQNISSTDDEDGPTSQVRTHHELKRYGQSTMFSWDMEESIREISKDASKSMRRSAMMDLCTKMADAGFVSQLLDSGFMDKLLDNMTSTRDTIFDFTAAVSVLFILQTKPTFAVVDQMYRAGVTTNLIDLVDKDADISKIARDRGSNMSKIGQESLAEFRALVLAAKVWSSDIPEKVSPQVLALKAIDLLIRNLRESGSTEALLTPAHVSKVVSICSTPVNRFKTTKSSPQDSLVLDLALSALETVSIAEQDHSTWPPKILQQLAEVIPVFLDDNTLTKTVEAMKLCMNITNNKSRACQPFSTKVFVQPLIQFIVGRFDLLHTGELNIERRSQVLAALTLSLGAMINLAELSDQARLTTIDDRNSIQVLTKTFVVGSKRADEADSVEESEFSVQVGFLTVLLGNLCLNSAVRAMVQASLPGQQFHLLLDKMKEFARIHEHVDKKTASRFEGSEGQEALNNYYIRIMHVVKKLENAKE